MNTVICVISDTHFGSTTAIAPPTFSIHTGRDNGNETQIVEANKYQQWLFACWQDFFDYAKTRAGIRGKTRKSRLILFHLGDIIDGLHHNSVQLVNELQDQEAIACNVLRPQVAVADKTFIVYGTPVHNGGTGESEVSIAQELGTRHDWELTVTVDGIPFDLAHHGRAGARDWTSSAAGLAVETALDYISEGLKPPRYVLRGHMHRLDDSGDKLAYTRAIVCPSWQLRTAYGHRYTTKRRSDIGGIIIDTADPDNPYFGRARYFAPNGLTRRMETV